LEENESALIPARASHHPENPGRLALKAIKTQSGFFGVSAVLSGLEMCRSVGACCPASARPAASAVFMPLLMGEPDLPWRKFVNSAQLGAAHQDLENATGFSPP
jgi:hypothetical protein